MEENFGNTEPGEGPDRSGSSKGEGRGGGRVADVSDEEITQRMRLLVAELRNGGREQAVGRLKQPRVPDAFCCLGVACEVAIANGLPLGPWNRCGEGFSPSYGVEGEMGSSTCLPESARDWYGFGRQDPQLLVPQALLDSTDGMLARNWEPHIKFHATALNDDYGLTLPQIGVCFQYTFLREDWEAERG